MFSLTSCDRYYLCTSGVDLRKGFDSLCGVRRPIPECFERATPEVVEPEIIPQGSKRIGEEITEVMEFKPAQVYVRVVCRPKYATPEGSIIIADLPEMAFPKSNAGASLISAILTQKYVDHLPLNRQGEIFKRGGYEVASSTMTNWVQHGVERLRPLYNYIVEQIRSSEYIQVDETGLSPEQRVKLREQRAFPVIRKLQDWMIEIIGEILPKSKLGKAIVYTSGIYPRLARYITDGRYRIDNNGVENAIRPIALGRKNYLYCGNDASAERTAIIYTIVACCKRCGVNPFEYMTRVLPLTESARPSEYHTLMPRELMGVGSREENSNQLKLNI
ncbi:MAG: transposase [Rikenellaceae bacterium]